MFQVYGTKHNTCIQIRIEFIKMRILTTLRQFRLAENSTNLTLNGCYTEKYLNNLFDNSAYYNIVSE